MSAADEGRSANAGSASSSGKFVSAELVADTSSSRSVGPAVSVGTMLARRYRLTRQLGEGGMGQVFEARDTVLGRRVAVKLISPRHQLVDPQAVKRMFREARAAAKIRHDNVVEVIDFVADEPAFLLMELLEGKSLRGLLREAQRAGKMIPWKRVCTFIMQVLAALEAAHRVGVIHRDIKPSNCFLVEDPLRPDRIKVVDFGVARVERSGNTGDHGESPTFSFATRPGIIVGTSPYLAPELWLGDPADARSDLYAVGIMMYELLLGVRPFRGSNVELQLKHTTQTPQSTRERKPDAGVPGWLDGFVLQLLAKQPTDRFASAREALESLLELAKREGVELGAVGNLVMPAQSKPRTRWPWIVMGTAGLVAATITLTLHIAGGPQPPAVTPAVATGSPIESPEPPAATTSEVSTDSKDSGDATTGSETTTASDASTTDDESTTDDGDSPEKKSPTRYSSSSVRRKLSQVLRSCAKQQSLWDPLSLKVSGVVTRRGAIEQLQVRASDSRAYGVVSSCFLAGAKKVRVAAPRREQSFKQLRLK